MIVREAVRVIQEERNGYTLQAGLPALRECIAGDYPHLNLSSDQVMVTAGSQEGLYLILRTLVEEGDEVLIPNPGFIAYPMITRMVGGRAVTYQLPAKKDFSFDIDDFKQRISPRTKVVIALVHPIPRDEHCRKMIFARWQTRSRNSIRARSSLVGFQNRCA